MNGNFIKQNKIQLAFPSQHKNKHKKRLYPGRIQSFLYINN